MTRLLLAFSISVFFCATGCNRENREREPLITRINDGNTSLVILSIDDEKGSRQFTYQEGGDNWDWSAPVMMAAGSQAVLRVIAVEMNEAQSGALKVAIIGPGGAVYETRINLSELAQMHP